MMAVRGPLGLSPSANPLISAFSPFSDHPDSPRPRSAAMSKPPMSVPERDNHLKAPSATNPVTSPQDPVAPSPVASDVGTEFTDVDELLDDEPVGQQRQQQQLQQRQHEAEQQQPLPQEQTDAEHQDRSELSPSKEAGSKSTPLRVETGPSLASQFRSRPEYEPEPQSVIHIPTGFGKFKEPAGEKAEEPPSTEKSDVERNRADSTDSLNSDTTVTNLAVPQTKPAHKHLHDAHMPPTPLQTSLPSVQDWSRTPRAQTRQDLGALSRPGSGLASIDEGDDTDHPSTDETGDEDVSGQRAASFLRDAEAEINALKNALSECWTLCNTLASLSHIHRERIFNFSGRGDMQEQAWKSCWKLCQNLYDTMDDNSSSHAQPTLDLCRDFCQALFDVRVRDNETADSVLRVSFELNNHLFNTHDRSLPEAFRERTLEFYITLCHRLMKQKSKMAEETDSLLRACWSLAEMLFSLRQNRREGRKPDEELLGSAVQACWELCDLFREGWTQIRPERGTPRPSQTTFTQAYNQAKRSGFAPLDENGAPKMLPETPTTIFEDTITTISPDEIPAPNILVIGTEASQIPPSASSTPAPGAMVMATAIQRGSHSAHPGTSNRWSSSSSVHSMSLSAVADAPNPTSAATSVETVRTPSDDPTLILLKTLFVKAALKTNRGYTRTSSDPNLNSLTTFAKNLPDTAFGTQAWQVSLLESYRKAIANDPGFRQLGIASSVGERGRVNAGELARAVRGMTSCVYGFGWLRDLYRYVFGFYVEDALKGENSGKRANERTKNPDAPGAGNVRRPSG